MVNFEIPTVSSSLVPLIRSFLKELRTRLKAVSEYHQLIWDDSVDNRGSLNYQNQLNAQNMTYFDLVDGIFLNYWWKPESLAITRNNARER